MVTKSVKILFADDDPYILEMIKEFFAFIELDAEFAQDGEEVLKKCAGTNFDLLFVDYSMPGLNGIEIAKRIRERLPRAYIVLLTGLWSQIEPEELTNVDEILAKPFQLSQLKDIIIKVSRRVKFSRKKGRTSS